MREFVTALKDYLITTKSTLSLHYYPKHVQIEPLFDDDVCTLYWDYNNQHLVYKARYGAWVDIVEDMSDEDLEDIRGLLEKARHYVTIQKKKLHKMQKSHN